MCCTTRVAVKEGPATVARRCYRLRNKSIGSIFATQRVCLASDQEIRFITLGTTALPGHAPLFLTLSFVDSLIRSKGYWCLGLQQCSVSSGFVALTSASHRRPQSQCRSQPCEACQLWYDAIRHVVKSRSPKTAIPWHPCTAVLAGEAIRNRPVGDQGC
jgi:hypothetical protein